MKTFRHPILLGAVASLSFLIGSVRADDTVEIKQHWTPGKTYSFTQTMNQTSSVEIGEQKMDQKMENTTEMSAKVLSEGGKQHVIMRYDHVVMNMEMGPQKMSFDSAKPDDSSSPATAAFGALAGKEFKMLLDDKGQPVEIENWDEIAASFKGLGPAAGMISKDTITQAIKQSMLQATPGHPVKPGDKWPLDFSMDMAAIGKISMKGNMALHSVGMHDGARSAEIATDAKVSLLPNESGKSDSSNPLAALNMKIEDGTMTGTTWFDLGLGMVREVELHQNMTMTMNNPADPTKTLSVPMKQVIRIELNKVEDNK